MVLQIARNTWGPGTGTAIYSRVSTADHNPELQLREIQDYADRQGWKGVETHQDTISGGMSTPAENSPLYRSKIPQPPRGGGLQNWPADAR